jgi:hypothetical protein
MSAITGIGEDFLMAPRARAASMSGTATLTISHPAFASPRICLAVRATFLVSVFVMD